MLSRAAYVARNRSTTVCEPVLFAALVHTTEAVLTYSIFKSETGGRGKGVIDRNDKQCDGYSDAGRLSDQCLFCASVPQADRANADTISESGNERNQIMLVRYGG